MALFTMVDWAPIGEAVENAYSMQKTASSCTLTQMAKRDKSTPQPSTVRSGQKTRQLLAEALEQPEGSVEERQAFSQYLKALHDVHAKQA